MYLKSISIYLIFNVISALLPIVTLPIFTRYLSPSDYGILAMFNVVSMLIGNLFRLELNSALKREYVEKKQEFQEYLGSAFAFANVQFVFYCLLLLVLKNWVNEFHGLTAPWFFLMVLLAYLRFYTVVLHHLFQISNRALLFSIWGLLVTLITFGLAMAFVVGGEMQWRGRVLAEVIVAILALPVAFYYLKKNYAFKWHLDYKKIISMLRFSFPLLCTSMLGYLLMVSDRFFIAEMLGQRELGLYTIAVQLSTSVGVMFTAILPAWESWIYSKNRQINSYEVKRILKKMLPVVGLLLVGLMMLPMVLKWVLPYLTSKDFSDSEFYLIPTMVAAISSGVFSLFVPVLVFMRKTMLVAYVNCGIALINLAFQYLFIRYWGGVGAAYALASSYFIGSLTLIFFIIKINQKHFYKWRKS